MLKETKVTLGFCTAPSFSQTTLQVFQLPHYLLLLHLSVPPQLGDNLQWVLVPSTKSVHNQKNENDSLCLASFTVFPHFDIEGMLDSVFFLNGDLSSKLLMKGSILAQRESRTSAGRSSLPGRSPAGSFRGPRASWDAAARRMKWSIRNKIWWTRNSPEEASTWLAPPHEAATFSGSRLCNRNHFFLALDLRDDVDCSESPRVPSFRRLVFFASPTSLFHTTPPSLHQSPNIPPFTSLVHVLAKETFWYFSSFLR